MKTKDGILNNLTRFYLLIGFFVSSTSVYASFIESTIGTAVVNDATATYYNPAALMLLKNKQFIALGSIGRSQTQFSGQSTQLATNYLQSGVSNTSAANFLPSIYYAMPLGPRVHVGVAVVGNDLHRDVEGYSILRYAQSSNQIQDLDLVPGLAVKLNKFMSIGVGLNRSHAHFLLEPISGLPGLNIPDSQSHNESSGDAWGEDVGILITPTKTTVLGFNYRTALTYNMHGKSTFNGPQVITSDNYHFNYWTPARSVFSINHFVTPKLGFVGTVQYIQWSIFDELTIHNIATGVGVLPTAQARYKLHNSWLTTLGSNYRISSKWIIRGAASYTQTPSNGQFQIDSGDIFTIGASTGYNIFKNVILDCSYAHAFITKQKVNVMNEKNATNGTSKGSMNGFAMKLIVNM